MIVLKQKISNEWQRVLLNFIITSSLHGTWCSNPMFWKQYFSPLTLSPFLPNTGCRSATTSTFVSFFFFFHQPFIRIADWLSFFFPFLPHIHLHTLVQEFSFSAWKLPDWQLQWIKLPLCRPNKSSTTGNLTTSSLYPPLPTPPTSKRIWMLSFTHSSIIPGGLVKSLR